MHFPKLIIVSLLGLSFSCSNAQTTFEFMGGAGKMVKNYPQFPELNSPAWMAAAKYTTRLNGSKPWHRYYWYPWFGISLTGGSLGNNEVLGYFKAILAEMRFQKNINAKWSVSPVLSFGAAYFTDPYNENDNPENVVIGSRYAFCSGAGVELGFQPGNNSVLFARVGILHGSNSHYSLPNVGMNIPSAFVGYRYTFKDGVSKLRDTLAIKRDTSVRFNLRVALGMNEQGGSAGPVNGPRYPIYLVSAYMSRKITPINKVSAGIEVWYNSGVYDFILSQDFYESDQRRKSYASALVFAHEFLMGHWSMHTSFGLYVYNPFYREKLKRNEITGFREKLKTYIPARIGFQYYLKDATLYHQNNFFAGIYIKTNFGQADFLETSLGYTF